MRHGSLFSGIGGFDLAAEWMGWENVFHCEWNPFGQKVLHHYWPNAESFNDITKTDFTKYAGTIDIISGGFPCQPYSSAGKRLGKEDERHLWPEMLRAIREISPSYVVGENVRGLANWNRGLVFEEVCADLENIGYQVAPCIIPACGIGAPHRRERIWFVAYSDSNARRSRSSESGREKCKTDCNGGSQIYSGAYSNGNEGNVTDSQRSGGLQWRENIQPEKSNGQKFVCTGWQRNVTNPQQLRLEYRTKSRSIGKSPKKTQSERSNFANKFEANGWARFPTQSPVCGGNDGFPDRLDGIAFSKWRAESIKAYGNAIVPQVAYQIFKAIQLTDENTRRKN
jgi:DNA (cytosine-5)-methyltransferase 1